MAADLSPDQHIFVSRHLEITPPVPEHAAQKMVRFMQARLAWESARTGARTQLEALEAAIRTATGDAPYAAEVASKTPKLFNILEVLDMRLGDQLDDALNAPTSQSGKSCLAEAASTLKSYRAYIASDPMFAALEDNPFHPVSVRADLNAALDGIASQLAAALKDL